MLASDLFDPTPSDRTPIACDLSAIEDQDRHVAQTKKLFGEREATQCSFNWFVVQLAMDGRRPSLRQRR